MNFVCFNGAFFSEETPLFSTQNRGFKYGDGLFETMKLQDGTLLLSNYHFDRLWQGLRILQIEIPEFFTKENLRQQIGLLCQMNNCLNAARVRLAVFRSNTNRAEYVIEATPLPGTAGQLNETGWKIDLYPYARKSMDALANLKSANYLIYVLADKFARDNGLNDAVVLNTKNGLCDTSKMNIFLLKQYKIFTPSLAQGCVNGVMRRHFIFNLKKLGYTVHQVALKELDLLQADEVFLTNAIQGMRWVQQFRNKIYNNKNCLEIYKCIQHDSTTNA